MKKILMRINIKEKTYTKLVNYGFMLEKNINDYLDAIAKEIEEQEHNLYNEIFNINDKK